MPEFSADEEYTQFAEEAEEKIVALDLAGNSKVSRSVYYCPS